MIFTNLLIALFLTIIVEEIIVFLLGFRTKNMFLVIALINVITNPIANYLILLNNTFLFIKPSLLIIIPLEMLIIFAEWKILKYAFPENQNKISYLTLSIIMNLSSFIIGIIIFGLP